MQSVTAVCNAPRRAASKFIIPVSTCCMSRSNPAECAALYRPSPRSTFRRARTDCNVARGTVQSFSAFRAFVSIVRIW